MRHLILTGLFAISLLAAGMSPSEAATRQDRYCLSGLKHAHTGSCHFATLNQCRAALSGRSGTCIANPRHAFAHTPRGGHRS